MNKNVNNRPLTSEAIKKYLSGEASTAEQHQVEKQLQNDALAAEATDGFAQIKADKINENKNLGELKKRLNKRVGKTKNKQQPLKFFTNWQTISAAASVILAVIGGLYFFTQKTNNQAVMMEKSIPDRTTQAAPAADSSQPIIELAEKKKESSKTEKIRKPISKADNEITAASPPPVVTETANAPLGETDKKAERIIAVAPSSPAQSANQMATRSAAALLKAKSSELDQEPLPAIGWNNYEKYLKDSLQKSDLVGVLRGKLKIQFTVEANGELSNIKIENKLSEEQIAQVIQFVKKGTKWLPAQENGKAVQKEVRREIKLP